MLKEILLFFPETEIDNLSIKGSGIFSFSNPEAFRSMKAIKLNG